jgi:hypothetical protein
LLLKSWKVDSKSTNSSVLYHSHGYKLLTACAHTLAHYQVEHQVERIARIKGGNMSTATVPEGREGYFPHWKLKTTGVIMPEERLPWGQTIVSGMQHGVAMAGGTIIAPLIMGFDPNRALLSAL